MTTQYCDYIVVDRENLEIIRYGVQKSVLDKYNAGSYDTTIEYDYTDSPRTLDNYYNDEGLRGVGGVGNVYFMYGDVRYEDGSTAETDDEYMTEEKLDVDNMTDNEIDELLQEILEELERQNPDLSTMEGLLESIYYRLGSLDSDDDNALLNDINLAILALIESNNQNNEELVIALLEIRDKLNGETSDVGNGETSDTETDHPNHVCGTLYNVKPLDKNWLNKLFTDATELKVEYQSKTYYLESCGCLLLDDKYYTVDMNYDNYTSIDYDFSSDDISINLAYVDGLVDISPDITGNLNMNANINAQLKASLSASQLSKVNQIVDSIKILIGQAVPYSSVTNAISFYMPIIYNSQEPNDIVLEFDSTNILGQKIDGFNVTVLSTSFFSSESAKEAITLLRHFLTVVIVFSWLLSMRKKIVSSF